MPQKRGVGRPRKTAVVSNQAKSKLNKHDRPIDELPDPPRGTLGAAGRKWYAEYGQILINDRILSLRDVAGLQNLAAMYEDTLDKDLTTPQKIAARAKFQSALGSMGMTPRSRKELRNPKEDDPSARVAQDLQIVSFEEKTG